MSVKNRVAQLLEDNIRLRNCDRDLIIEYFKKYVCINDQERIMIETLIKRANINIWGIIRIRADFQNKKNMYLSDYQIQRYRQEQEELYRQEYWN